MTEYYQRKLYAFLQSSLPHPNDLLPEPFYQLACWSNVDALENWWKQACIVRDIAASSDRINLQTKDNLPADVEVRHPISGQQQTITQLTEAVEIPLKIRSSTDAKQVFWWFWRFYPEYLAEANRNTQALLYPAHRILPDCPLHSYQSTVSALAGAMFTGDTQSPKEETPYLLLFSFSPVQEFIKASRKFLDFWAGSYLLHYLSAKLCWYIAQEYGPDAVIVPSLWGQDINDAFWLRQYGQPARNGEANPNYLEEFSHLWRQGFDEINDGLEPVERFEARDDKRSNSLSTAGFPNMITVLVPGKKAAEELGQALADELVALWHDIKEENDKGKKVVARRGLGAKVKENIQDQVIAYLTKTENVNGKTLEEKRTKRLERLQAEGPEALLDTERCNSLLQEAFPTWNDTQREPYRQELIKLVRDSNWEWGHLWDAQLDNTWEPYWAAVPLGNPDQPLVEADLNNYATWAKAQDDIAWPPTALPSEAERQVYQKELNVGTWWGSLQQRLRTAHMAVKNTRHWQIPAAPGPRSSLSGQFSAVHPRLNYQILRRNDQDKDFREGGGLPESSMRLFWLLMSYAYNGLFNGSEMLNALELTKRMAWQFGGVAESMGIPVTEPQPVPLDPTDEKLLEIQQTEPEINYDQLIRFPNLSSISAARFVHNSIQEAKSAQRKNQDNQIRYQATAHKYWNVLAKQVQTTLQPKPVNLQDLSDEERAQHEAQKQHLAAARRTFGSRTRGRPSQVAKTDKVVNPNRDSGHDYNGVMFSAKWLADEMNLEKAKGDASKTDEVALLRQAIDEAHKGAGFGDGSPGDWWVIVLGDGDGMGRYISGETLHNYGEYIVTDTVDQAAPGFDAQAFQSLLNDTQKRMGPATHIGLNRALLDFSNRLVPYLTEKRYCGRVIYSGGDDVMAVLPLEDLPGYLRSLRAAWSGGPDPEDEFNSNGGYWHPKGSLEGLSQRPHFTMGKDATMSLGIVIANKAVPLPTVLESLWDAEQTAKAMPGKDGLCFRVIYGGGNTLEALMKGRLLDDWWALVNQGGEELSPLLYRLSEELPKRASLTDYYLFAEAAKVIAKNRDESRQTQNFDQFCSTLDQWLRDWEDWARAAVDDAPPGIHPTGTRPEDLGYLLRFSAFWVSKNAQRQAWVQPVEATP
ncbi:type III-B CRISPR-associated protein Cas10/Cmr2 [filamentous cyanobacterium CCP5]|nr:type III-B CRISPR-associated protein Cas10/Cmr2 [filamentous cyanobacterium CCP5]